MTERIEILLAKYCSEDLMESEEQELSMWLSKEKNRKKFEEYIAINYTVEQIKARKQDHSILLTRVSKKVEIPARKLNYRRYAIAAAIAVLIGVGWFLKFNSLKQIDGSVAGTTENVGTIGSDQAILTLDDGTDVFLEKGKDFGGNYMSSDGEKITYKKNENEEFKHNYLTVPRSGKFYLELSDQTKVWLNSESKLKYPKSFKEGENRVVELVYGEAYFDVSSSVHHQGAGFKVIVNGQEISVLGTEFNIKAYSNDDKTFTTLIEGRVKVSNENKTVALNPGEQAVIGGKSATINVFEVNIYDQISWKDGVFSFEGTTLKEITKVISRWYDVDFEFENSNLEEVRFIGVFNKNQALKKILDDIKSTNFINAYEIKNEKIILK